MSQILKVCETFPDTTHEEKPPHSKASFTLDTDTKLEIHID